MTRAVIILADEQERAKAALWASKLPEGTRVHLSLQEAAATILVPTSARIHTPKLAHPEDAADFVMEVRETDDAGV